MSSVVAEDKLMTEPLAGANGRLQLMQPVAIWLIAFLPLLHTVATWDLDGNLSAREHLFRLFSLVVILGEIVVIWIAARAGLNIKSELGRLPKSAMALIFCWAAIAFAASLIDPDRRLLSVLMTLRYVLHGLFFAALLSLMRQSVALPISNILNALMLGAIAYVVALAAFVLLVPDPSNFPWVPGLPSATNIRQIGNVVGVMAIVPAGMLLLGRGPRPMLFGLLTLLLTFIAWSGTRGALAGLIAGCVVGVLATLYAAKLRNVAIVFAALALGIGLSAPLPRPAPQFGIIRMVSAMTTDGDVSAGRTKMWQNTLGEISEKPWLGFGSGRFLNNMFAINGSYYNHPHNVILQFIYDWGLLGGAAGLAIFLWLGIALWNNRNVPLEARFVALAAYTCIISISMIEGTLFHPLPMVIGMLMMAPALSAPRR